MNPQSLTDAKDLFQKIKRTATPLKKVTTVICPPFVFLSDLNKARNKKCILGAQDVFWKEKGSFTGEVSPAMLKDRGVTFVIIGHSERRALGETDEIVNKKVHRALEYNLFVILCVGERERDKDGDYLHFIEGEIRNSLSGIPKRLLGKLIIAYEPIWAIGAYAKGADTPDTLLEMVIFIRKIIGKIYGRKYAMEISVLYGGSVDDENARGFLKDGGVSGLLVGRSSLDAKKFSVILKEADQLRKV